MDKDIFSVEQLIEREVRPLEVDLESYAHREGPKLYRGASIAKREGERLVLKFPFYRKRLFRKTLMLEVTFVLYRRGKTPAPQQRIFGDFELTRNGVIIEMAPELLARPSLRAVIANWFYHRRFSDIKLEEKAIGTAA